VFWRMLILLLINSSPHMHIVPGDAPTAVPDVTALCGACLDLLEGLSCVNASLVLKTLAAEGSQLLRRALTGIQPTPVSRILSLDALHRYRSVSALVSSLMKQQPDAALRLFTASKHSLHPVLVSLLRRCLSLARGGAVEPLTESEHQRDATFTVASKALNLTSFQWEGALLLDEVCAALLVFLSQWITAAPLVQVPAALAEVGLPMGEVLSYLKGAAASYDQSVRAFGDLLGKCLDRHKLGLVELNELTGTSRIGTHLSLEQRKSWAHVELRRAAAEMAHACSTQQCG
jgi:hypothetical protein